MTILNQYTANNFFPRITLPTRIQPPSFSLIDNILCNSLDNAATSVSGVLITDISDHKMIFTVYPNNLLKQKIDKIIEIEKKRIRCQWTTSLMT